MGVLDPILNPVRYGTRVVTGAASRGLTNTGSFISNDFGVGGLRMQLQSYEGRELFDSKKLGKFLKRYRGLKRHLMKYRCKKKGKGFASNYVQDKIFNKYKNNPALLNKVLLREVFIFSRYYQGFLEVVKNLKITERDLVTQENAAIIKDEAQLTALIEKIPDTKDTVMMIEDFKKLREEIKKMKEKEIKQDRQEAGWMRRLLSGATKPVRGFAGLVGRIRGVNFLAYKIIKLNKRIFTRDTRRFNEEFIVLRREIEGKKITPATISRLRILLKDYAKIRRYYHEISKDIEMITGKLFEDMKIVLDECVVPFYAAIINVKGAKKIMAITDGLKTTYQNSMKDVAAERFQVRQVYAQLGRFVTAAGKALGEVTKENDNVIANLSQTMNLNP